MEPALVRTVELLPIAGIPEVKAGDDLAALIEGAAVRCGAGLRAGDVVVIAQKVVSKAEGRVINLADVTPSSRARELAAVCLKDPRIVELVLQESTQVVRCSPEVLIVRHRLGFTVANAGIDQSNVAGDDEHALLLPVDPDRSATQLYDRFSARSHGGVGVIINDSFGRPWRLGTCGVAIGCGGVTSLTDMRGQIDRHGRVLQSTTVATADEIAAAASLVMGQAAEGLPVVLVRGLPAFATSSPASALIRAEAENLFS